MIFSTPTYLREPDVRAGDRRPRSAREAYADRAVFIHVEIWRNYQKSVVNTAAIDWVCCDATGGLTEPWLFLIGSDGVIKDQVGSAVRSRSGRERPRPASPLEALNRRRPGVTTIDT